MTWEEIKLATLQKMFAADGNTLVVDESTKDYIAAMPQACNEGLQLLSTAGKFIIKSLSIANNPIDNLIPKNIANEIAQLIRGIKSYPVGGGHSYYFECLGKGTATVKVGGIAVEVIDLDSKVSFKEYRGMIINSNDETVEIVFECSYPISIKNIAVYEADYESREDIPAYGDKVKYDLTEIAPDFYEMDSQEVYYEGDNPRYIQTSDFYHEGNKKFVVDRELKGNFTIYYKAYPVEITAATANDYELPIDKEVAVLLPLYMASQLYKDDDIEVSTSYRNEFDIAFSALSNKQSAPSAERFTSESGWI